MKLLIKLLKGQYTISHLFGRFQIFSKLFLIVNQIKYNKKPKNLLGKQFKINIANNNVLSKLNVDGYYNGISLDKKTVKNIIKKIKNKRVFHPTPEGRIYGKIYKPLYIKKSLKHATRVYVDDVNKISEIQKISRDSRIFEIFYSYFGYYPQSINSMIFLNYPIKMNDDERLEFETVKYHFDIESPNSLYWSFYLTDVNKFNAPHALIKKTHKEKPFKFLMSGANINDSDIFKHYNQKDESIICLSKGKGFIEDASIYHKNFPAKKKIRLMLQLRYY